MSGTGTGTPNLVPKPVSNFGVPPPKIGAVAICVPLDFSVDAAYTVTLANLINAGRIDGVQSMFVDNAANASSVTVSTQQGQNIVIPPNSQAYLPVLASTPPDITFASTGGVLVTVQLLNMRMPACVWSVEASGGGGGTVVIAGTVDVEIVGQSGTLAVADATLASILDGTIDVALVNTGTVDVAGTVAVTGTVGVSGTVPVSGTVAPLDGLDFTATGTAAGVLLFNAPGPATGIIDTEGYDALSVQVTNAGTSCNMLFQGSNDGATWNNAYANSVNPQSAPVTSISGAGVYIVSKSFRYLRLNLSSYGSGTFAVSCALLASNPLPGFQYVTLSSGQTLTTTGTVVVSGGSNLSVLGSAVATNFGMSTARLQSAASTNATSVKTSAGNVFAADIGNNGTVDAWLKIYNKASAPTVGTDTPAASLYLPKGAARSIVFDALVPPWYLSSGLAYAITGGAADSDTTAVAANQVTGILFYK